ncbi:hypothetical protein BUALT_Bualt12G0096600 [Buddleja alternifolia]|uniref:RecQ mediated genome instability protein 1 OB-fold domain-containing protein n=1 Tax=Buddleja alternifolia TaxID=168488 RepID=A0AAV6WQ47_9LAMI|nr:hypothetical protein BUALT_Bualt12G0096600 [Buddleja alternifolia]
MGFQPHAYTSIMNRIQSVHPKQTSLKNGVDETHLKRGWCFRDTDRIQRLISTAQSAATVDSIESELLLNMDLRSIGGKCLPEPSLLCKTSLLQAPKILQVCSCRDISRSCITDASGTPGNQRLLRLKLTDGHSEITAIEYSHMPSIPEDLVPGTKVLLQNKADVCSGILCLKNNIITILGGVVQSLYEEWQMKRKYLDVSRHASRLSNENASDCPPPFEKLKIQAAARGTASILYTSATKGNIPSSDTTGFSATSSNDCGQSLAGKGESSNMGLTTGLQNNNAIMSNVTGDVKLLHNVGQNQEKPTSSSTRPKVTASTPVQNQVAAQKLLQKTSQPNSNNRNSRSQRQSGKTKEEESSVMTLDEWERRKAGVNISMKHEQSNISEDEVLARQLQNQFDLEDIHAQEGSDVMESKNIKMSMFSYERDHAGFVGRTEYRGRGRGRGRGRNFRGKGTVQP